jgi:hypothetical protein
MPSEPAVAVERKAQYRDSKSEALEGLKLSPKFDVDYKYARNMFKPTFSKIPIISAIHRSILRKRLGFEKNERVHAFAAMSGHWARFLAELGLKVEASDIAPGIVAKLEANRGKIQRVFRIPAQYTSIVPNYYDWSYCHEPVPLLHQPIHLVRMALINRKGLKISASHFNSEEDYLNLKEAAHFYGAEIEREVVKIPGRDSINGKLDRLILITIKTNEKARQKATTDLWVERKLNAPGTRIRDIFQELSTELRLSDKEISQSLERLRSIKNVKIR